MSWTSPDDIRDRLQRQWRTGKYLRETDTSLFPLRIGITGPTAAEMVEQFPAARSWAADFLDREEHAVFTVTWKEQDHRRLGRNRVPVVVIIDDLDKLARFLGTTQRGELTRFREAMGAVKTTLPEVLTWAQSRPFELLRVLSDLPRLMAVALWMRAHPRPGIYLRQVPVPGVDTKFLERHKGLLDRWLELVLPESSVNKQLAGVRDFEGRYGFRTRPELIRFRFLDQSLTVAGFSDISVPAQEFARWNAEGVQKVFVLENDVTGLAFPDHPASLVLFGRGYSSSALRRAEWLHTVELLYWGDLDTHGFAILNQFRSAFPHTRSILMDRRTLLDHETQWGVESKPANTPLVHLTTEEQELYDDLRFDHIRPGLRLEQELIGYAAVEDAVSSER